MGEQRFRRLQVLYAEALDRTPDQRTEMLAALETEDIGLAAELRELLACDDAPGIFDQSIRAIQATLERLNPLRTPACIGHYQLHEVLGEGGMGKVFRATREIDGVSQEFALKLIHPTLLSPALLSRFTAERQLLASLEHPGICRMLDAGTTPDGSPYIVMERVRGVAIDEYCDSRNLSIASRLRLLQQVVLAIAHAHAQLVVHRDIKAGNVLIDQHDQVRVLDFGIAKSLAERGPETAPAERFVSLDSAAPEQLGTASAGVGVDIYALGVLAFRLLSGQTPFATNGLDLGQIVAQLRDVPAPLCSDRVALDDDSIAHRRGLRDARSLRQKIRGDLDLIVARCLRKLPGERYSSALRLAEDLGAVLEQRPISLRASEGWYRFNKFVGRHRLAVILGAIIALLLVSAAAVFVRQSVLVERGRQEALLERDRARMLAAVMQEAFIGADPSGVMGGDVRARDILQAAHGRVADLRTSQPQAFAELAATLVQVELALGLDDDAMEVLPSAIEVARSLKATSLLRQLLLSRVRAGITMDDDTATRADLDELGRIELEPSLEARLLLAKYLTGTRRAAEALPILQTLAAGTAAQLPDSELALEIRLALADCLRWLNRYSEGIATFDQALEWLGGRYPQDHGKVLKVRLRRIHLLRQDGRTESAVTEAEDVQQAVDLKFGPQSAFAAHARTALALALNSAGRLADAVQQYRVALAIWDDQLGTDHPQTLRARFNLGLLTAQLTSADDTALQLIEDSIAAAVRRYGEAGNPVLHMRLWLADFYIKGDRHVDALDLLSAPAARSGLTSAVAVNQDRYAATMAALKDHFCRQSSSDQRCAQARAAERLPTSVPAQ